MQTEKGQYNELPEYETNSEEVFYDMKTSDGCEFDQMTEDEMPIPENCEEDAALSGSPAVKQSARHSKTTAKNNHKNRQNCD